MYVDVNIDYFFSCEMWYGLNSGILFSRKSGYRWKNYIYIDLTAAETIYLHTECLKRGFDLLSVTTFSLSADGTMVMYNVNHPLRMRRIHD